jgi:hypothetical protein
MHKMMKWISKTFTRKPWFPLYNYMFIKLVWQKNKSLENLKVLKIWNKRLQVTLFFY